MACLSLLPLTGLWDPGDTLRTSTLVAQLNCINQQQHRLPGYEVHVEFVDSRRDVDYPARSDGQILLEFQINAVCCREKKTILL